ncbi:MAG: diguanylate cyclase [Wenzhouxiangellaceae bacterium]|nr:diguanylate cyclase [Wenzhouxiangellaceae bacterium]
MILARRLRCSTVSIAKPLLCAAALLTASGWLQAQYDKPFRFWETRGWTIQEGLPQSHVSALEQGPQGYLWVGTQVGLARFDGVRYETFVKATTPGLAGDYIHALFRDSEDRLWIGTHSGVSIFADGAFTDLGEEFDGPVLGFAERVDGSVAAAAPGLPILRPDGRSTHLLPGLQILSVTAVGDDLYAGSRGQLVRFVDGAEIETWPMPASYSDQSIDSLAWHGGRLWVMTDRATLTFTEGRFEIATGPDGEPLPGGSTLYVDRRGALWISSYGRILRLLGDGDWAVIGESELGWFPWVLVLTEDHEGNFWLGSATEGLYRAWPGWYNQWSQDEGLGDEFVWSMTPARAGGLFVGMKTGVDHFSDGRFRSVVEAHDLPNPSAYTLLETQAGELLLGTEGGLAVRTPNGAELVEGIPAGVTVHSLREPEPGLVWVGTEQGLFRLRNLQPEPIPAVEPLDRLSVRYTLAEGNGLWVATERGLYWLDANGARAVEEPAVARDGFFTVLADVGGGRYVAGTLKQGLLVRDGDRVWRHVPPSRGLPSDTAFYLAVHQGWLWGTSHEGLFRLRLDDLFRADEQTLTTGSMILSNGSRHPGAQNSRCCNGAGTAKGVLTDNRLWLPTLDGMIEVPIDQIQPNRTPPNVLIQGLETRSASFEPGPEAVSLPLGERDVRFRFTALSFRDPDSMRFRVRLDGFDDEWREVTEIRSANYTNLPAGRYTFQVLATNNAGVWSPEPASQALTVPPYVHEQAWFRWLVLLVVLGALGAAYWTRTRLLRRRQRQLEKLVAARTAELRETNEQLDASNRRLEKLSESDALTGLKNRRFIAHQLPRHVAYLQRRAREDGQPRAAGFALVDLDRFKHVNDEHGHSAGDAVLVEFSELLRSTVRTSDYCIRWGGEEFLIVSPMATLETVQQLATRLLKALHGHEFPLADGSTIRLTCSIGISTLPADPDGAADWEHAMEIADACLYRMKRAGRDGWVSLASEEVQREVLAAGSVEAIQDALDELGEKHWRVCRGNEAAR